MALVRIDDGPEFPRLVASSGDGLTGDQCERVAAQMAVGVLHNILAAPLGQSQDAYFVTGENRVHALAHNIVCERLGLHSPVPDKEDDLSVVALGMRMQVHRIACGAVNSAGVDVVGSLPYSVLYSFKTTGMYKSPSVDGYTIL